MNHVRMKHVDRVSHMRQPVSARLASAESQGILRKAVVRRAPALPRLQDSLRHLDVQTRRCEICALPRVLSHGSERLDRQELHAALLAWTEGRPGGNAIPRRILP